jgi:hypothetical protein
MAADYITSHFKIYKTQNVVKSRRLESVTIKPLEASVKSIYSTNYSTS